MSLRRWLTLVALIAAGESVFLLPFVLIRVFRPTFLDVFGITNLQLGAAFSLYGIVAMVAYFGGGPLADRFSARKMMTAALLATGAGGFVLATIPPLSVLTFLYAFWGATTILLFWAALIRATREWGGPAKQGQAYGLLDGGRGLLAALLVSVSLLVLAGLLPADVGAATEEQRRAALGRVIWIFTGLTLAVAALVWVAVPERLDVAEDERPGLTLAGVRRAAVMPVVWLQAIIIICAYVGYKSVDDFSLFARDALGYDEVSAARVGTLSFWVRPFAAVAAGLLADRIDSTRVIIGGFVLLLAGSTTIALGTLQPGIHWMLTGTIVGTSLGIYALRGVYFALFGEGAVPLAITGSATGLVSVLGYTPDVFMGPLMGYLIDRSPGPSGHQHVFAVVAGFALVGWIATLAFRRIARSGRATPGGIAAQVASVTSRSRPVGS